MSQHYLVSNSVLKEMEIKKEKRKADFYPSEKISI